MSSIKISHPTRKIKAHIQLPASKSESNRLLILNALSGNQLHINNLSNASDTQNLLNILSNKTKEIDVQDAGTSMRFLTGYYAATNQHKIITGTERMKQRPIAPLVQALSELGFDIRYQEKENFPPLEIVPVNMDKIDDEVWIEGNVSSQYISSLLLIASFLPKGICIHLTSELISRPYVEMTLKILEHFGIKHHWSRDGIAIHHTPLQPQNYTVGADWSAASYWYAMAFLADEAEIFLEGLQNNWVQGDQQILEWMKRFGISTEFTSSGATIKKTSVNFPSLMGMNFKDNPDLAQTFAVMFAAKNICSSFSGIDSLKIKETDRVTALQTELAKINMTFEFAPKFFFYQLRGAFCFPQQMIHTYNDHRMAMSFAPLALLGSIEIENPEAVKKSYPGFWKDLQLAGFVIAN